MKKSLFLFLLAGTLGICWQKVFGDEAKYEVHGKFLFNIPLAKITINSNPEKDISEIFVVKNDGKLRESFIKNGEYFVKGKKISMNIDANEINPFAFKDSILIPAIREGKFADIIQKIKFDVTASKNIRASYLGSNRRDDLEGLFNENPVIVHEILFEPADKKQEYIDKEYRLKRGLVYYFINKEGKGIIVGGILTLKYGFEKNVYAGITNYQQ